jgi:uncharacterized membrane protein YcaP (DUF421 family)
VDSFTAIFGTTDHVTWLQECARAALIFFYGLLLIRISGRRTFGRWSALDLIVSVTAGSTLSRALTGEAPLLGTMAATAAFVGLHWVLAQTVARSSKACNLLEGTPVVLAENGQFNESARLRHSVSQADIDEALHRSGLEKISDAYRITLAPNGMINVIPAKTS